MHASECLLEAVLLVQPRQFCLRAGHILGQLTVTAYKLSRYQQIIQTEWPLHPEVFVEIYHRWLSPQMDLYATRDNNKLCVPSFRCESLGGGHSENLDLGPYSLTFLFLEKEFFLELENFLI